ncbi:VPLPA-CTERM sorting domain-containing protein [Methylomonas sp. MK1]|uniref:VPLPA-CTERM sorting domain-containing protein n=1 Tax=Methylomonas sp. MK1 TaxID=1131552 RepID=UPI00036AE1AE|nr:VPLPA-CTERM sorting domain-containing protein [Methylomonas sp. MK1]
MKNLSNKQRLFSSLMVLVLLTLGQNAQASSSFDSQATISFDVSGIGSGVTATSAYAPADASYSYIFTAPESVGAILPAAANAVALPSLGFGVAHTFAVNGYASAGSFTSQHVGWYQLDFLNESAQDQQITLTVNYTLQAFTQGDANTDVILDFWDTFSPQLGNAFFNNGMLNVTSYDPALAIAGDKRFVTYSFNLAQGASRSFFTDVTINGNLQPAAVPLPAAVWSFLAGLMGILGAKKRKKIPVKFA